MNYKAVWDIKALEETEKLEAIISNRTIKKVKELRENPFSKDIRRLRASEYFRLRVGDYRIIFSIKNNIITILKVGHRKNIYNR